MTDYKEEQQSELEALRSIYSNEEFTEISSDPYVFDITVVVEAADDDKSATATVRFTYTPNYPDTPPDMCVTNSNLSGVQVTELEQLLREQAEEELGVVMVFSLVSAVQEKVGELLDNEVTAAAEQAEQEAKQKEEPDTTFHGTPVTKETFSTWKESFDAEMANKCSHGNKEVKLTGKQLFERDKSLITSDIKFIEETSADDVTDEIAKLSTHDS